jgi:hypothetical protein
MKKLIFVFIALCVVGVTRAQENSLRNFFEVKGVVKDRERIEISGLRLNFKSDNRSEAAISDENGKFVVRLPAGKYEITVNRFVSEKFIAFIEISDTNLNPNNFELNIQLNPDCCAPTTNGKPTAVVKYVEPEFPLAARAVRAGGDVVVSVKIGKDGKVVSAKAESGHPLLIKASETAAKEWIFTSDEAADAAEREGRIVFAFVTAANENPARFKKSGRLEIFSTSLLIDLTQANGNF